MDWVGHMPGGPDIHGIDGIKPLASAFYTAFPDMLYVIEDMVAEGDKVAVRWKLSGVSAIAHMEPSEDRLMAPPRDRPNGATLGSG